MSFMKNRNTKDIRKKGDFYEAVTLDTKATESKSWLYTGGAHRSTGHSGYPGYAAGTGADRIYGLGEGKAGDSGNAVAFNGDSDGSF